MRWNVARVGMMVVLATLGLGCGDDGGGSPQTEVDAGPTDAAADVTEEDLGGNADAAADLTAADVAEDTTTEDVTQDATTEDVTEDAGQDASSDVTVDSGPTDPYEGRPLGQCASNEDCPDGNNGPNCNRSVPGGVCLGCGSNDDCPAPSVCSEYGACVIDWCGSDQDCPPGRTCGATGLCGIESCVAGACPTPMYTCGSSDRCERVSCASQGDCPERTTCLAGLCIEDRELD